MLESTPNREFAFALHDVARLMRNFADHKVAALGMTRAQWVVLIRLDRTQGLKQCELAEILEVQPITLTRLLDRLCDNGLIERRADPADRRVKRLYLTAAATPLLERLNNLGADLLGTALAGLDASVVQQMLEHLSAVKENLREAIQKTQTSTLEKRYG